MTLIPMPSPRGTNHARQFLHGRAARALGAGYAYDSADGVAYGSRHRLAPRRVARDQSPEAGDSPLDGVKRFLANRLSPEDFAKLEQMLQALSEGGEGEGEGEEEGSSGQDDPSAFPGRPRPGGVPSGKDRVQNGEPRVAQDSRRASLSYLDLFPANAAVGIADYGRR